ncbi:MAG: hypothetical protein OEX00_05470 [Gammaproteobacteria bacterium]|nr:hypothetical protein [Gammaproteobacteria bacterium]
MGNLKFPLAILLLLTLSACASQDLTSLMDKLDWRKKETDKPVTVAKNQQVKVGPKPAEHVITEDEPDDAESFLIYYQSVSTLSAQKKSQELEAVRDEFRDKKDIRKALKFALTLLAVEDSRGRNLKEALNVLEEVQNEVLKKKSDSELTPMVHFVWDLVRTSYNQHLDNLKLRKAARQSNEQVAELEKQINALKSIEKSIHEREVGALTENR